MAASVRVHALEHAYGKQPVVRKLSFALAPGQIGCLLGPSGCGKTTVLRCIAGFEPVQGGEIALSDRVVSRPGHELPPEQRGIGMVFQDYALFPHLTVARTSRSDSRDCPRRRPRDEPRRCWSSSASRMRPAPIRTSCRAACSSALRSRARLRPRRSSCCWTSHSRTSTSICASASRSKCGRSSRPRAPRPSSSRTISTRRSPSPTRSAS